MKFTFIKQHSREFSIERMCDVLEVSRSGYYAWLKRGTSQRALQDRSLAQRIIEIFRRCLSRYGSPRIHAELFFQGIRVSRKRVARLMQELGLRARCKQRQKARKRSASSQPAAPNLLQQNFAADAMNRKWLADITYIHTREGFLHLAAVIDVYSRRIVGWSMSRKCDSELVKDAMKMALQQRPSPTGLLHHSDQGVQYTSKAYRQLLEKHGIKCSMSDVGNCYDNAMIESFFATLKNELMLKSIGTIQQARQMIFRYIEIWYNRSRRHSALGYHSPLEFELLTT